jgi:hypothetical protein
MWRPSQYWVDVIWICFLLLSLPATRTMVTITEGAFTTDDGVELYTKTWEVCTVVSDYLFG